MDISIRPYTPEDLTACRGLWRELTRRHREIYEDSSIGGEDPGPAFDDHIARSDLAGIRLAEHGGAVVGMHGLLVDGDHGEIEPVVVTERQRSRGIGRMLLENGVSEARARSVRYLSIRPVARNVEAIELFHEAGFRALGHLDMFIDLADDSSRSWKRGIVVHGQQFTY
jgi:GNAT superfamily N-acetyltransferase